MLQRRSFNSFIKYPSKVGTSVTISQKEGTVSSIHLPRATQLDIITLELVPFIDINGDIGVI